MGGLFIYQCERDAKESDATLWGGDIGLEFKHELPFSRGIYTVLMFL